MNRPMAPSLDDFPAGCLVSDLNRTIIATNTYLKTYYGHHADSLVQADLFRLFSKASEIIYETYLLPLLLRDGRCDELQLALVTADGDIRPVVVSARLNVDVTAEKTIYWSIADASQRDSMLTELSQTRELLQEKIASLHALSFTDKLTGLPNRAALTRHVEQKTRDGKSSQAPFALAFVDLDGFKAVNDQYGHAMGDELLRLVAKRMTDNIRNDDMVARLGGDEFVILLNGDSRAHASDDSLPRLIRHLAEPFELESGSVGISASIGVTFYPQAEETAPDQLLRQADHAMYQAKIAGRNQLCLFNVDREKYLRDRSEELSAISAAIENDEFEIYYQPKINIQTGEVLGAEALLRWQHSAHGLLRPSAFLPLVNETAVGIQLGQWVLANVLAQLDTWRLQGLALDISVNIAGYHLQHPDFLRDLGRLLAIYPSSLKRHLELEVLETSTIEDIHHVSAVLTACKQMGIRISLDDFGTGYSTLSHLRDLSVDTLKIDRSFIRDMSNNEDDMAILKGIIGLAKAFQCDVIAEGVETRQHGRRLVELGCEWGQGYFIARPMPAPDLQPWVQAWRDHEFSNRFPETGRANETSNHNGGSLPC